MKKTNEFRLTLDARSVNEGFARVAVSAFAAPLDPTLEELADLKTAVSEAVTNCIVHGYKDCCGKIYIHTVLLDPPAVRVTVRDKGCGIVDVPQAMTPLLSRVEAPLWCWKSALPASKNGNCGAGAANPREPGARAYRCQPLSRAGH